MSFLGILLMVYSLLRAMHGLRTFPSDDDNDYEHATSGHGPGVTTPAASLGAVLGQES